MFMNKKILEVISKFQFKGTLEEIKENSQGNINSTYILIFKDKDKINKYLLQKINSYVFKEPYLVMKNIELVTKHIKKKIKALGLEDYQTLTFIKTVDNDSLCTYINDSGEKEYYRAFIYIDNCVAYNGFDEVKTSREFYDSDMFEKIQNQVFKFLNILHKKVELEKDFK